MSENSSVPDQNAGEWLTRIPELCDFYAAELKAGRRGNVKQLVEQVPPEGRSELLRELFAIRCEHAGAEQIEQIAEMWRMVFPDFRLKTPAAVSPRKQRSAHPTKVVVSAVSSEPPLEVWKQIDAVCLQFEADLKAGRDPDLTRISREFPAAGRSQLLTELLRVAVEYRQAASGIAGPSPLPVRELEQTLIAAFGEPQPIDVMPENASVVVTPEQETHTYADVPNIDASTVIGPLPMGKPVSIPAALADYELLEELGRGGMGVVYKARQISLQRLVALKMVLRAEFASADNLVRFQQEAESAAQLDHPGIVPVFEVGETGGLPYFSMAFVEGPTLSKRLLDGPLGVQDAAELVRQLAVAVAYAHAKGIVHRDLKPGNVLLDQMGKPRITDFGLAKRLDSGQELTTTGQIVGTPSYMPPEQARGLVAEIDGQSDIYSLGAVLYAGLTGRPPFQAANPIDTLQQVIRGEIARPSLLNKSIPRDLEIICLKCLSKRKWDRYATAAHMALDLGRWQRGEPIQARPINRFRRAWMWCRRRPALAAAASVAVIASFGFLIAIGLFGWYQAQKASEIDAAKRDLAEQQRQLKLTVSDYDRGLIVQRIQSGDVIPGMYDLLAIWKQVIELKDPERQQAVWGDLMAAARRVSPLRHRLPYHEFELYRNRVLLSPDSRTYVCPDDKQSSRYRLWDLKTGRTMGEPLPEGQVPLRFSPDGRTIVGNCQGDNYQIIDALTGLAIGPEWHHSGGSSDGKLSQSGRRRVRIRYVSDTVRFTLLDTATDSVVAELNHEGDDTFGDGKAAFHPNGQLLATAMQAKGSPETRTVTVRFWDTNNGKEVGAPLELTNDGLARPKVGFTQDGTALMVGWRLIDMSTRQPVPIPPVPPLKPNQHEYYPEIYYGGLLENYFRPSSDLVSHNGRRSFSIPRAVYNQPEPSNRVGVLDLLTFRWTEWTDRHLGGIVAKAVSPDDRVLLTGGSDGRAILWDTATGRPLGPPLKHPGVVNEVFFARDGQWALTASDSETRLWDAETGQLLAHPFPGRIPCLSEDGQTLVTQGGDVWELTSLLPPYRLPAKPTALAALADGTVLAACEDRHLYRLKPQLVGYELLDKHADYGEVKALALRPDGKELLVTRGDHGKRRGDPSLRELPPDQQLPKFEVSRLDPQTLQPVAAPLMHPGPVHSLAWSADGTRIAAGFLDVQERDRTYQEVQVWDATTAKPISVPLVGGQRLVGFSQDAKTLRVLDVSADGSKSPQLREWSLDSLAWTSRIREVRRPLDHTLSSSPPMDGVFLSGGKTYLFEGRDGNAGGAIDVGTGKAIDAPNLNETFLNHGSKKTREQDRDITESTVRRCRVINQEPLGPEIVVPRGFTPRAVSPDGTAVVMSDITNATRCYDLTTGKQIGNTFGTIIHWTPPPERRNPMLGDPPPRRPEPPRKIHVFRPDGQAILLDERGDDVAALRLWDIKTGKPLGPASQFRAESPNHYSFYDPHVTAVFGSDGRQVAVLTKDYRIVIWDPVRGRQLRSFPIRDPNEHISGVSRLAWSPDGKQILIAYHVAEVELWDVDAGRLIGKLVCRAGLDHDQPMYFGFDEDGTIVLEGPLALIPPAGTDRPQKSFQTGTLSPDGALMLAGYDDGTIQVFDAATDKPLGEPMRHEGPVTAIAFTHDEKELLTTGVDRALKRWPAPHQFPHSPDAVQAWIERNTALSLDPNNNSLRLLKRKEWLKLGEVEAAKPPPHP